MSDAPLCAPTTTTFSQIARACRSIVHANVRELVGAVHLLEEIILLAAEDAVAIAIPYRLGGGEAFFDLPRKNGWVGFDKRRFGKPQGGEMRRSHDYLLL